MKTLKSENTKLYASVSQFKAMMKDNFSVQKFNFILSSELVYLSA